MKKIFSFFLLLFLSSVLFSQSKSGKLVILHTNDLHSNLNGFSPEREYSPLSINDDLTKGGFARLATMIKQEQSQSPDNLLVLDAGDFLMGSFFHLLEAESGFQLPLMKKMGYDVVCIGNHEFDFGTASFADIINSSKARGELPALTLANIAFSEKSAADDSLHEIFERGDIRPYYVLERGGFRIGIFGLMGDDADKCAPYALPATFPDRIKTAKQIVKTLGKKEKVDLIVCLSHSGVQKQKNGAWGGEDFVLAKKVPEIDLIVSGHTHTELPEPLWQGNTPIVQAGSQAHALGRLELDIKNGKITSVDYQLLSVDDSILGDSLIHNEIVLRAEELNNSLLKPIGLDYFAALAETSYELVCNPDLAVEENNLGPFVADAIKYYIDTFSPSTTDVSIVAAGTVRDKIRVGELGVQSAPDMFRVMSLGEGDDKLPGYPLAQIFLSARELKQVLEILLLAEKKNEAYYCYYAGLEVEYDNTKRIFRKIKKMKIGGEEIDFSKKNKKLYSISANSYLLEFVGEINRMSFGLVKVKPKDQSGNFIVNNKSTWIDFDPAKEGIQEGKEWIALVEFLKTFADTNNNGIPDFPEKYKNAILRVVDTGKRR